MNYEESMAWLSYAAGKAGAPGLTALARLLERLGRPQDHLRFIHIAGTNGKGSVMAFLEAVLEEAGYRTGRYISPVLFSYEEKIRAGGKSMSREDTVSLISGIRPAVEKMEEEGEALPTLFEMETAMSLLYFARRKCEVVLLETGMGGAQDATNVVENKILTVFSSIGMDHMEYLGDTREAIARNKAGIMRPGVTAVCDPSGPEVVKTLTRAAEEIRCPILFSDPALLREIRMDLTGSSFSYRHHENMRVSLAGPHQLRNAALALEAVDVLRRQGFEIPEAAVRQGLSCCVWEGRFQVMCMRPLVIMDGAHNPDAAKALMETLRACLPGRGLIYIFGVFSDKEYDKIIKITCPAAREILTVQTPDNPRALDARVLAEKVRAVNPDVRCLTDMEKALPLAMSMAGKDDAVIIFGSLSFLWQVKRLLSGSEKAVDDDGRA